jgi:hypothetical protein
MKIDEILNNFERGPRGYALFETYVLQILKLHIETQGKIFEPVNRHEVRVRGDGIALHGFDQFNGKTLIDITLDVNRRPLRFIERDIQRANDSKYTADIQNLLVISARPVRSKTIERLAQITKDNEVPFVIHYLGPEFLENIAEKYPNESEKITKNLFAIRLESTFGKKEVNWKKERDFKIGKLNQLYKRGQVSLFLGAGVSSSAGMPDWNKLLNSLFVSFLTKEFDEDSNVNDRDISQIVDRLNTIDEPTSLMAARYIRKGFTKDADESEEFNSAITSSLYKLRNKKYQTHSDLIKAIGSLCTPKMTGSKIKSIVTYNFDDLIERELERRSIDGISIYSPEEIKSPDELPIYHVHGFLPEEKEKYEGLDRSTLVFSEEGYHQIYLESYHWSNLVQLNRLKNNTCIMIGLSMSDPNLRRLLDISTVNIERPRHFAFLKRISDHSFCYKKNPKTGNDNKAVRNIEGAKSFLQKHHVLNEEILKELGVSIIWYEDHDELPGLLQKIKE